MVAARPSAGDVWSWLREIADPEIPVLSIVDLGIVRDVCWPEENELRITITPTYSGCPAIEAIADDIRRVAAERGVERLHLETQLFPPWTTDWMPDDAKERLREYGIAPPVSALISAGDIRPARSRPSRLATAPVVTCPRCGSNSTQLLSRYGSTPCKALYKCASCLEPFDAFKGH